MTDRCGECDNCKKVERVKRRVLACCNPPFSHADQGVVDVWNDALQDFPCEKSGDVDYSKLGEFEVGQRVEAHPGCDCWMQGDKFGTVVRNTAGGAVYVRMDVSKRRFLFAPDRIRKVK